jgi:2-oxoglutarate dehydrogenase E1 component
LPLQRLVFCSGQIYYELLAEREKRGISNIALVRLEQLAPFAFDCIAQNCEKYRNAEVIWAQQEPK